MREQHYYSNNSRVTLEICQLQRAAASISLMNVLTYEVEHVSRDGSDEIFLQMVRLQLSVCAYCVYAKYVASATDHYHFSGVTRLKYKVDGATFRTAKRFYGDLRHNGKLGPQVWLRIKTLKKYICVIVVRQFSLITHEFVTGFYKTATSPSLYRTIDGRERITG